MSEVQNPITNSTQQQQQQQQQSYTESKINSAESERLYLEMKKAWLWTELAFKEYLLFVKLFFDFELINTFLLSTPSKFCIVTKELCLES